MTMTRSIFVFSPKFHALHPSKILLISVEEKETPPGPVRPWSSKKKSADCNEASTTLLTPFELGPAKKVTHLCYDRKMKYLSNINRDQPSSKSTQGGQDGMNYL